MPRVYSYVRFSSRQQIDNDSRRRQLAFAERYAEDQGLEFDASLTFYDAAVSAFTGRNAATGRLAAFLRLVEEGKVERGSVLCVEALDRLSRQQVGDALVMFLSIINAGVVIVTQGEGRAVEVYDRASINEPHRIIIAIIYLTEAHRSSALKSDRLKSLWAEKRRNVASEKITAVCPAWLRLSEDRRSFAPIPARVKVVRSIFAWCAEGSGINAIVRRLNGAGVPAFGRSASWTVAYVAKLLQWRAVLGEYQPCLYSARKSTPIGDPIPAYYPAVIAQSDWDRAQVALTGRRMEKGRTSRRALNLFTGLLRSGDDGSPMQMVYKGKASSGPQLVSAAAKVGRAGSVYRSFPYDYFEKAFLGLIEEIKPSDLVEPAKRNGENAVGELTARIALLDHKVKEVTDAMDEEGASIATLARKVKQYEGERLAAVAELEKLRRHRVHADAEVLGECKSLKSLLYGTGDKVEIRTRLRHQIKLLISDLTIRVALRTDRRGRPLLKSKHRSAVVTVTFRAGYRKQAFLRTDFPRVVWMDTRDATEPTLTAAEVLAEQMLSD